MPQISTRLHAMHEVITLSASQPAGHILTHLYNVQESHLAYSRDKKLTHSNDVFLRSSKVNSRTNYYPRAVNIEFSGGYGHLGQYAYHENVLDVKLLAMEYGSVVIEEPPNAAKNEYQKCLDVGKAPSNTMLTLQNTCFWTSYNKILYRPSSLLEIPNYRHPGKNKNFPRLQFDEYPIGEQEYKNVQDAVDEAFRCNLEALDNVQGINFVTEVNTAWGGFTNDLIKDLKDEFFNNGANSKHCLWTYGVFAGNRPKNILTEIRAFVGFAENSSLFFPLTTPDQSPILHNYEPSSPWHMGALRSMLVSSIWGLNCQLVNPVRMATIEAELQKGYGKRTIVNETEIREKEKKDPEVNDFGILDVKILDYYNTSPTIKRGLDVVKLGVIGVGSKQISSVGIDSGRNATYTNDYMKEIYKQDTFPEIFSGDFSVNLKQTTAICKRLKDYRKIILRAKPQHHLRIIEEKGELIEQISALLEEYTVGYSDESENE